MQLARVGAEVLMKRNRLAAASAIATAAIGFLGLAAPAGVAAATPASPTAFNVTVGQLCVENYTDANTTFMFDWQNASAATVAHQELTTDDSGHWGICSTSHPVTQGDTFSASNGSGTNTYTVPDLTLSINRDVDLLTGHAPAGSVVRGHCDFSNGFEPCIWHDQVRARSTGFWAMHIRWDVSGGQTFDVRITSDDGNKTTVFGTAPFVNVELGQAAVSGAAQGGATETISLYDASMTLKGTAKVKASLDDGTFSTTFRDSGGHAVRSRPEIRSMPERFRLTQN